MCGIAGLWQPGGDPMGLARRAQAMATALAHRGPDGAAVWTDPDAGIALAHRRLAVIDLSPGGTQPMEDRSGRWVITYNGELYNYVALREELAGLGFPVRGQSDTAVLLEAIACWGVREALSRTNGMFALAAWDRRRRALWLARDHAGIKPLFYRATEAGVLFASATGALLEAGGWTPELDADVAAKFLRAACVPAPFSALSGVAQLRPGEALEFTAPGKAVATRWFDAATLGQETFGGTEAEAADQLHALLADSVRLQRVADVPVGAFLSGGIDSSLVTALAAAGGGDAPRSFTIGFAAPEYAEQDAAAAIARHLGTQHTERVVTEDDVRALVPIIADDADEPFADSSILPTLLLSKITREQVTVALSGDGGDELFGGYRRHVLAARHWKMLSRIPGGLRHAGAGAIGRVPEAWLDRGFGFLRLTRPGESLHKLAGIAGARSVAEMYGGLTAQWPEAARAPAPSPFQVDDGADAVLQMRRLDLMHYMPDDVLAKVDRASMRVALEVRVPYLDPRIIRFAFTLPQDFLFDAQGGKKILRSLLSRHVPEKLFARPKMGFSVPLGDWLRGPLRPWAEELLDPARLRDAGLYDVATVRAGWAEHLSGRKNRHNALWCVLMLEAWRTRLFGTGRAAQAA